MKGCSTSFTILCLIYLASARGNFRKGEGHSLPHLCELSRTRFLHMASIEVLPCVRFEACHKMSEDHVTKSKGIAESQCTPVTFHGATKQQD